MRLLILSDLHLELWGERAPKIEPLISRPDIVVLAGDIHTKGRAPAWAAQTFTGTPVLYIAGNHEFYGEAIETAGDSIRKECARYPNVHYLDCQEYVLEGVRFLGATLWTDFSLFGADFRESSMIEARAGMNDYRRIRVSAADYRKLHPQDTARLHAVQRRWLRSKLSEPFAGRTVVVSHMAPSIRSVAPEYAADPVSAAFASTLDDMAIKADLWIHGHGHNSVDYQIEGCRVVANPMGYMTRDGGQENRNFDPNFIVRL